MTRDGTTDENARIVPIGLKRRFDFMGNMGTLAELMKRPEIAARLEQGEKEGGAEARKYPGGSDGADEAGAQRLPRPTS